MTSTVRNVLSLKRSAPDAAAATLEERLHKVLATAGLGSRRMLETRIEAGEVQVNGTPATLGVSVHPGDRVEIDSKRFVVISDNAEQAQVIAYNKPEGVVTTREDPEGRPTVFEHLPRLKGSRWIAVGRLDINTTGLLLLTTDGDLANSLMHPSSELEREYICRVHGEVPDEVIERLRSGVELDDGPARFDEVAVISRGGSHSWFRVVIREGRNREVRRMWEAVGLMVSRLKRVRYANFELPRLLKREHSAELDADQVKALREACGAGDVEARLTLAPVIGQRRAATTEFRPDPNAQKGWTSTRTEEAREFGQFDRIRDDGWRGAGANKGKRSRGGVGPRPSRPKPSTNPRQPAPGSQYVDPGLNPAVLRSWFPDSPQPGARRGSGQRGQGGDNANGNVAYGNRNPAYSNRAPHADGAIGNRPPRGDGPNGNRPPRSDAPYGNRPPRGDGPSGNRPPRSDAPYGNRPPRGDGPSGNRPPRSDAPYGNRPPRGDGPSGNRPSRSDAPYGNRPPRAAGPRDDSFGNRAPRDDAFGNRAPRGNPSGDDARGNRPPREGNRGGAWGNRGNSASGDAPRGNSAPRGNFAPRGDAPRGNAGPRSNGPRGPGGNSAGPRGPGGNSAGPRGPSSGNRRGPGGPRRPQ